MTPVGRCTRMLLSHTSRPTRQCILTGSRPLTTRPPCSAHPQPITASHSPSLHRSLTTSAPASAATPATSPPAATAPYHLLRYRYVDNMMQRRTPVRPLHLKHTQPFVTNGQLLLGGAVPPEVKEAILVFKGLDKAAVEKFAREDPYVREGLVEEWRVHEWTVVVGSAM